MLPKHAAPVTTAAAFSIRKRPEAIFNLDHYVQNTALVRGGGRIGPVYSQRLDLGLGSRDIAGGLSKRRAPQRQTIAFPGIAFSWVKEGTATSSLDASQADQLTKLNDVGQFLARLIDGHRPSRLDDLRLWHTQHCPDRIGPTSTPSKTGPARGDAYLASHTPPRHLTGEIGFQCLEDDLGDPHYERRYERRVLRVSRGSAISLSAYTSSNDSQGLSDVIPRSGQA